MRSRPDCCTTWVSCSWRRRSPRSTSRSSMEAEPHRTLRVRDRARTPRRASRHARRLPARHGGSEPHPRGRADAPRHPVVLPTPLTPGTAVALGDLLAHAVDPDPLGTARNAPGLISAMRDPRWPVWVRTGAHAVGVGAREVECGHSSPGTACRDWCHPPRVHRSSRHLPSGSRMIHAPHDAADTSPRDFRRAPPRAATAVVVRAPARHRRGGQARRHRGCSASCRSPAGRRTSRTPASSRRSSRCRSGGCSASRSTGRANELKDAHGEIERVRRSTGNSWR